MIALAWVLIAALASADAPAPGPTPATFAFDGRTTDGRRVVYPDAAHGKPLVLVVGLDDKAAKPSALWSSALQRRVGARATVVGVAVLDRVPRFVRGFVERAIARQIGTPRPDQAGFVTTYAGTELRARAPRGDDAVPVIYVFDASGSVVAVERRPFSEDDAAAIERDVP